MSEDNKAENNSEKLEEKHFESALKLYEEKSKDFRRLFGVLFTFALVFFVIIFLPYASLHADYNILKGEEDDLEKGINNLTKRIDPVSKRIDTYKKVQHGLDMLRLLIVNEPDRILNFT